MPKAIKGNAGRKPPEPSANHSDLDDWCRLLMPDLQPISKRLDESIRATVPGLDYAVKWKRAYYGLPRLGWVIEIAAYDVSVNVLFLGGADSVHQGDQPGGDAATGVAEVDRASGTNAGLDVMASAPHTRGPHHSTA